MKWVIRISIALVVLIAGLLWFFYSQIGTLIKYGIETVGPEALKVPVTVQKVGVSVFGTGSIEGLELGNPEGFAGPKSLRIGTAELAIEMSTVTQEKIIIRHIRLLEPEIHLEAGPAGTNLSAISKNARAAASQPSSDAATTAPSSPATSSDTGQPLKLQVDEILVRGAKLNATAGLIPGVNASATLPDIKITSLGTGPDGITPAALTAEILTRLAEEAVKAGSGGSLKDLLKGGDIKVDTDGLKKGMEGLGKLLK